MLKLNDSNTELMLVTSKRSKHLHNLPTSFTIGNAQIPFKQSVKNLGFTLDCHLTMNAHVSNIARTCYYELRRLASIRRFLTSTATATHVSAFVLSRIDYCSSLLFGSTHRNLEQSKAVMSEGVKVPEQEASQIGVLPCRKTVMPSGRRPSPWSCPTGSSTECVPAAPRAGFMVSFGAE